MTTRGEFDRLEAALRDVAECLRGVPFTTEAARDLHLGALALKRAIEHWRDTPPPPEALREAGMAIASLLDQARVASNGKRP